MRTIACIPGVTGDWQHPGGGVSYSTSGHVPIHPDTRPDLLREAGQDLDDDPAGRGPRGYEQPVKCLWVYGANPMGSTSDQNRVRRGPAQREDLFTVVMEQFPTDTVDYADIVLPATMQIEHTDLHAGYGHMYLMLERSPRSAPPGECLSTTETFRRVARRMGLTDPSLYDSDLEIADRLLSGDHPSLAGITVERLRREGWARLDYADPFVPFADGFPTPSGKLEFAAQANGVRPLAHASPPPRPSGPVQAGADHPRLPHLPQHDVRQQSRAAAPIAGHPGSWSTGKDAADRGWTTDSGPACSTPAASSTPMLEISERVAAGVVASDQGQLAQARARRARRQRPSSRRDADMGSGAVYHDNLVEISPRGPGLT